MLLTDGSVSVRLSFGGGTVRAVRVFRLRRFPLRKGFFFFFSVFQRSLTGKDGSGFGSWITVLAVSVSGKTVPTVPVSGSSLEAQSS